MINVLYWSSCFLLYFIPGFLHQSPSPRRIRFKMKDKKVTVGLNVLDWRPTTLHTKNQQRRQIQWLSPELNSWCLENDHWPNEWLHPLASYSDKAGVIPRVHIGGFRPEFPMSFYHNFANGINAFPREGHIIHVIFVCTCMCSFTPSI